MSTDVVEDEPQSVGALTQLIAQDCQSNRIEIEQLGKRLDRIDERTVGIFEMLEKHDKWLMRLLILGEGTGERRSGS